MAVRYKNKKSGKVATFSQPMPHLERSKNFERVEEKSAGKSAGKSGKSNS